MNKLFRLRPPGTELHQIKLYFILGMIVSVLFSLGFLLAYFNEVRFIHTQLAWAARTGTEYTGGGLSSFSELVKIRMILFPLYCAGFLIFVFFNYRYFWQESKSNYVMRRVKRSWELHLRCWAIPLTSMAVAAVSGLVLLLLYWLIYVGCAPKGLALAPTAFGWRV